MASIFSWLTPFQRQLAYVAAQGLLLAGALMTHAPVSTVFWIAFAAVTITRYAQVIREAGRKQASR